MAPQTHYQTLGNPFPAPATNSIHAFRPPFNPSFPPLFTSHLSDLRPSAWGSPKWSSCLAKSPPGVARQRSPRGAMGGSGNQRAFTRHAMRRAHVTLSFPCHWPPLFTASRRTLTTEDPRWRPVKADGLSH